MPQIQDLLKQLLGGQQRGGVQLGGKAYQQPSGGTFSRGGDGTTFSRGGDGTTFSGGDIRALPETTGAVSTAGPSMGAGLAGSPMDLFRPPANLLEAIFKPGMSRQDVEDTMKGLYEQRVKMNQGIGIRLGGRQGGTFPLSIFQANPKAHSDPRIRKLLEDMTSVMSLS